MPAPHLPALHGVSRRVQVVSRRRVCFGGGVGGAVEWAMNWGMALQSGFRQWVSAVGAQVVCFGFDMAAARDWTGRYVPRLRPHVVDVLEKKRNTSMCRVAHPLGGTASPLPCAQPPPTSLPPRASRRRHPPIHSPPPPPPTPAPCPLSLPLHARLPRTAPTPPAR